jgi:hypothetical protein
MSRTGSFSRRDFLKASAVSAGAAALGRVVEEAAGS